ncbi:MAG: translocation/assembly module TamB domain-containing protein, partial [Muribaculaceae bacterium]|nr:translocation/assembly module TamB domain-containing protein [Muribaculaceae bacterium]
GISPLRWMASGRLVISDVEIIGPQLPLWRDSIGAPLNVDPILARLRSDRPDSGPKRFSLALHTAVVRRGAFSYHVLSEPAPDSGRFSPRHVEISGLRADLAMPRLTERSITLRLKRLSMREASGLRVNDVRTTVEVDDTLARIMGLSVEMPMSRLRFADIAVTYPTLDSLGAVIASEPHTVALRRGSRIYLPDFSAVVPQFTSLPYSIAMEMIVSGTPDAVKLERLSLRADDDLLHVSAAASLLGAACADSMRVDVAPLMVGMPGRGLLTVADAFGKPSAALQRILPALGEVTLSGHARAEGRMKRAAAAGTLTTAIGSVRFDVTDVAGRIDGTVRADSVHLGRLLGKSDFGSTDFSVGFRGCLSGPRRGGNTSLRVSSLQYKGHDYHDISADATLAGDRFDVIAEVADELLGIYAEATAKVPRGTAPDLKASVTISHADIAAMGLWDKHPGYIFSGQLDADLSDISPTSTQGLLELTDLSYAAPDSPDEGVLLAPITVQASGGDRVEFNSDIVSGYLFGHYDPATLVPDVIAAMQGAELSGSNDFTFSATVHSNDRLYDFFGLPVKPLYTSPINGGLSPQRTWLTVDLPYLQKGNKAIRRTRIDALLGCTSSLLASTVIPTADGDAKVTVSASMTDGTDASLDARWAIDRVSAFEGSVSARARLLRDDMGRLSGADVNLMPTQLVFNDSTWQVHPARIQAEAGRITVDSLRIDRSRQSVIIGGVASVDSASRLNVSLRNIDLDYLFATLRLGDALQFGGIATGDVSGAALLSPAPILRTNNLHVDAFSYCHGTVGDADIAARWDNAGKAIMLAADIAQANGRSARVNGLIGPGKPGRLDIRIAADRTPVGMLNHLLAAFASDVTGEASGTLRVYGTLKNVQLGGALQAHNVGLRLDVTNCTYFTDDSVTFTPGVIAMNRMKLRDPYGHTAELNGAYRHNYLKDGSFSFRVTDARRMLVYNLTAEDAERIEQDYYGRIYGSGSVDVNGRQGVVRVGADMTTDRGSEFTFVLSDREQAGEYSFLTIRDAGASRPVAIETLRPDTPEMDRLMAERANKAVSTATATVFSLDLKVNVTPDARMTLVM